MFARRTFMTSVAAGMGGVALSSLPKVPATSSQDRLLGMFVMGAYGDALGSWNESHGGLSGQTSVPELVSIRGSGYAKPHPWGYWIADQNGPVVTDDTAYRICILHPYLRLCLENQAPISEQGLWESVTESDPHSNAQIQSMRMGQARDWQKMRESARRNESHLFYTPNEPVVFGLYSALELAALYKYQTPLAVYQGFSQFSELDQGAGGVLTGLLASVMAAAHRDETIQRGKFCAWWNETLDDIITSVSKRQPSVELDLLIDQRRVARALAKNWSQTRPHEFVGHLCDSILYNTRFRRKVQQPYLCELFWMYMSSVADFAGEDDGLLLRTLASCAGDSDTMASMMGSIMGACYGRQSCGKIMSGDRSLEQDLIRIENVLSEDFQVNLNESATVFERLTIQLKEEPVRQQVKL